MTKPLLQVDGLIKHFSVKGDLPFATRTVHAVDGIDFSLDRKESIGIVGESGSGKTTLARCIMSLYRPTGGDVRVNGRSIYRRRGRRSLLRNVQMVFQDPGGSLNPRFSAQQSVAEPLIHLARTPRRERSAAVQSLFDLVGIRRSDTKKLPHQFSGGQQQRIAIARAIAPQPEILILDEPTSALDLSLQAQVIALLVRLQEELGLAYVLITHDLSVVRQLCDRLLVIYLGRPVELGMTSDILDEPLHPYSQALIGSVLIPDPVKRDIVAPLKGEIPSPTAPPSGCRFHPRCPRVMDVCSTIDPEAIPIRDTQTWCHLYGDSSASATQPAHDLRRST